RAPRRRRRAPPKRRGRRRERPGRAARCGQKVGAPFCRARGTASTDVRSPMIKHDPVLPPEFIYPIDDWRLVEKVFTPEFLAQNETVMSTANGYLGMRGGFFEGEPAFNNGTFVNGFHETWPIPYGEKAYGFAKTGQTIVNCPDGKIIRLYVDDELFIVATATLLGYERGLEMRAGAFYRDLVWETASGKRVQVKARRLVSFHERHLA